MKKTQSKKGFGILELLVALAILGTVMGLVTKFTIENLKASLSSEAKNEANRELRKLTNEFDENVRNAHYFVLYKSFETEDRDDSEDRLNEGNSGDFIVLLYQGPRPTSIKDKRGFTKIVGYYRAPLDSTNPTSIGSLHRFEINYSKPNTAELETLLPDIKTLTTNKKILNQAKGLADGRLFYNFRDKGIMINGRFFNGNTSTNVTSTYNFIISPRG